MSIKRAVIVFKIVHVTLARFSLTCVAPLPPPPHPFLLMGRLLEEIRRKGGGGGGGVGGHGKLRLRFSSDSNYAVVCFAITSPRQLISKS